MSENKKALSKVCLVGFILVAAFPVLLVLPKKGIYGMLGDPLSLILSAALWLMPLVGFILSIAGVVTARRKGQSGRGFGIAGIVISIIYALIAALIAAGVYMFVSALSPHKTDKSLRTLYTDSEIVSVTCYHCVHGDYTIEVLDEDRLDEFVTDLDSIEIQTGGFANPHSEGSYIIEMELEDGTYLEYNGLTLEYLRRSRMDDDFAPQDVIESETVRAVDGDFWDFADDYFTIEGK